MKIFLTGGTGFIGTSLLAALRTAGHDVHALARSKSSASSLEAAGAVPVLGALTDATVLTEAARAADAVVHTGSPGDATSAAADEAAAKAFIEALAGTGKPYLHTSGAWVHGSRPTVFDETAPFDPPQLTRWRLPIVARVLAAGGSVIAPGIVYGNGGGLPALLLNGPQADGALLFPGSGEQHWTTIHVEDLAALYVAALGAAPGSYFLGVSGDNPTVRSLAEAASIRLGLEGKIASEGRAEIRARLGLLAEAFELDQQATPAAGLALGWQPTRPTLLQEFETGSYAP